MSSSSVRASAPSVSFSTDSESTSVPSVALGSPLGSLTPLGSSAVLGSSTVLRSSAVLGSP
ncbi:hypothetical protein GSS87_06590 [Corynebacterium sp. 4HC-13]|uniref:Uncharacterized protein n=1 Tax=Corynebacterium anserum TaxID=2684406 RepID=A0A7G7YR84_9CORY|nr:hypothetical protein [Corynebacterium anserum]QNH97004.1 hypothetical protein GP473_06965 [Corynebacterium anserum]